MVMVFVALVYNELENSKCLIYRPPLIYKDTIGLRSSLTRSRKCFPFSSGV